MTTDFSIQEFAEPWWVEDNSNDFRRGRLVKVFIPHVDQIPKGLEVIGRGEPTAHNQINYKIEPLRINAPRKKPSLPAAAMPILYGSEVHTVYKAKKRPAIIISEGGDDVPKKLTRGKPNSQTAPTILVAPCYGADEGPKRSGFKPELIKRFYACEYPQFIVDSLPIGGATESVIRLDHIQPVGKHHDSVELTQFCLSDNALGIIDEWIEWLIQGDMDSESCLYEFREERKKH